MGLTYGAVRQWRHGELEAVFQQLTRQIETLIQLNDDLSVAANPAGWTGKAAGSAGKAHRKLVDRMERIVAGVAAVKRTVGDAAEAVEGIHTGIAKTDWLAADSGYRIGDDGSVADLGTMPASPDRERMKAELKARVKETLRRAGQVDDRLAKIMREADRDRVDNRDADSLAQAAAVGEGQGGVDILKPPKNGSPAANAGWWAGLTEDERKQVLRKHPEWIGNRDGIPAEYRDKANRARLGELEDTLRERYDKLRRDLTDNNPFNGPVFGGAAELDELRDKLDSIDAIRRAIAADDRKLLMVDTSGDMVKAAVADGDIDNAKHIGVFTGGVNTTVDGELVKYSKQMDALQAEARRFTGEEVATVTWLGYEAPQHANPLKDPLQAAQDILGDRSALSPDSARKGGKDLAEFLNGLDTSRDTDAHVTAMGHSYGSLTTSYAVQRGTGVDDVIFFGSPGIGTHDVRDLRVPDAFLVEADGDWIADTQAFGPDPASMKDMKHLDSGDIRGHSDYLDSGSQSLRNMGAVVAGAEQHAGYSKR